MICVGNYIVRKTESRRMRRKTLQFVYREKTELVTENIEYAMSQ